MANTRQRGPTVTPGAVTLDKAKEEETYVVDRVPEENADLLRFLNGARLVPRHKATVLQAAPNLGVLQVETEAETVSI